MLFGGFREIDFFKKKIEKKLLKSDKLLLLKSDTTLSVIFLTLGTIRLHVRTIKLYNCSKC